MKLVQIQRGAPKHRRLISLFEDPSLKSQVQRTENELMRDKVLTISDEDLLYVMEEKGRNVSLTEKGRDAAVSRGAEPLVLPDLSEQLAEVDADDSLSPAEKAARKNELHLAYAQTSERIHNVGALLKAYSLFEKDVDYVVQDGKVDDRRRVHRPADGGPPLVRRPAPGPRGQGGRRRSSGRPRRSPRSRCRTSSGCTTSSPA